MEDHSQDIKLGEKEFVVKNFADEGLFANFHKGCRMSGSFWWSEVPEGSRGLVKIKHINIIKTSGVLVNQIAFVQEFCLKKTGE